MPCASPRTNKGTIVNSLKYKHVDREAYNGLIFDDFHQVGSIPTERYRVEEPATAHVSQMIATPGSE